MKKKLILAIIPLFFVFVLPAQDELPEGENKMTAEEIKAYAARKKVEDLFYEATRAKLTDNPGKAIDLYTQAVTADPTLDAAWYELSMLHFLKSEFDRALECADKAHRIDPKNKWYMLMLANLHTEGGDYGAALKMYDALIATQGGTRELLVEKANLYMMLNQPDDAIKMLDLAEKDAGPLEEITMRKVTIYMSQNKQQQAISDLEKLVAVNPEDTRLMSMLAETYLNQSKPEKALELYRKIEAVDPSNPYINISMADYYRRKGDMQKSADELKKGFANPQLEAETKIQVMMAYYTQLSGYKDMADEVLELSKILAEVHPNDSKVLALRGEMLMMNDLAAEATPYFKSSLELDPSPFQIWEGLMRSQAISNNLVELLETSGDAMELFSMQPSPYYFNGYANYSLGDYPKAVKAFNAGAKLIVNNDDLLADFYGMLGDAYQKTNQMQQAYSYYEQALKLRPENATLLNNYAYYLSLEKKDLKRAEEMAKKANELSPENASYLDTYAWVLFQMGKYKEALSYMEQALKASGDPGAVEMEHYGDILFKLNRKDEALSWWQKASAKGGASDLIDRKIKERNWIE